MLIISKIVYFYVFILCLLNLANSCPPIPHKKGVSLECKLPNITILDCGSNGNPIGTIAKFSCEKYYFSEKHPHQGEILCSEDDQWEYISEYEDFHCEIECGVTPSITPVIVGGSQASKYDFPWHASIFLRNQANDLFDLICGGSLIDLKDKGPLILTAAHCLPLGAELEDYRVILGGNTSTFLEIKDQDSQIFGVSFYDVYPSYNSTSLENDIAVLKLSGDIQLSDAVKPICLERATPQPKIEDIGIVAGFGKTEGGLKSEKLLKAALPVKSREDCLEQIPAKSKFAFPDTKFCAGFSHQDNAINDDGNTIINKLSPGICFGDSGGGLTSYNPIRKRSTLIGIAHAAFKDPNFVCSGFGYFQSVQKYIGWIREAQKIVHPNKNAITSSVYDEGVELLGKKCGSNPDWVEYKDEKCFRFVKQLATKEEASKICGFGFGVGNSLPVIKSLEEHEFLLKFLEEKRVTNGVWLGAARGPVGFLWDNGDGMDRFSNWAPNGIYGGKNCSRLVPSNGFWVEEDCEAENLVICEKLQVFSNAELLQNFIKLRSNFHEMEGAIEKIIPIGFLYFQVGSQPSPTSLWPGYRWEDVSKDYEGLFFRVTGGGAAGIGTVQDENAPRLRWAGLSFAEKGEEFPFGISIPSSGFSDKLKLGRYDIPSDKDSLKAGIYFRLSAGEVRPKNTAMRVWKRI